MTIWESMVDEYGEKTVLGMIKRFSESSTQIETGRIIPVDMQNFQKRGSNWWKWKMKQKVKDKIWQK